jgi:protein-tyrosine-phosphatase
MLDPQPNEQLAIEHDRETFRATFMTDLKVERAPSKRYHVLFLCDDNCASSIMAEAILRRWGADDFCAHSCGIKPAREIDPQVNEILLAQKIWRSDLASKNCAQFLAADAPPLDFVISLGERPPNGMPAAWPPGAKLIHWRITEPTVSSNSRQRAAALRRAFLELENRIKLFVLVYQREAMKAAARAA